MTLENVHLTEEQVLDHVRGDVPAADVERVVQHIARCATCRMLVAEAAKSSLAPWSSSRVPTHPPTDGESESESDSTVRFQRTSSTISVAPLTGEADPMVGQLVAKRFRVQRLLGTGGMGFVYQAFDELLKVRLAMKLIRPELAVRKTVLKLLYRELVIARRVNHPNVCRVYDIGLEDGLHFFTMELVKGETLDDLLARTTVPPETARDCLIQIALALEAAHAAGVIHRDLKPGNVMVDTKGHVTVMDFGLARDLVSDQSIVQGPVGTPAYWAPEQALGQQVTPASDVYAFGLIALRLFGIRSRTEAGLATAPLLYRDLLARCLAPPPTERYASGRELREALVTLHARVVAAPPLSVARVDELAETQAFRRPSRITRVAALGAVFVAGALAGAWLLSRAPHVESAAPPPSVLAPGAAPTTAPQPTPASAATLTSAPVAAPASASTRPASSDGAPPRRPRPPSAKPPKPAPTTEIPVLE